METKSGRRVGKRKSYMSENEDSDTATAASEGQKKTRPCAARNCPSDTPICCVRATSTCCGNGYTSRWYHISNGEHYCNECFEHYYRSSKGGYKEYMEWKRMWSRNGKADSSIRYFMADQKMPNWVQCNLCDKWRQVYRETELTPEFVKKFVCTIVVKNQSQEDACSAPEDFRVSWAKDIYRFATNLQVQIYIKNSLYAPYVCNYFYDRVGIAPSDTSVNKYTEGITEVSRYLHPFQDSEDTSLAMSLPPHAMTIQEQQRFPEFAEGYEIHYLIVRNTVIGLWNLNVKKWVTWKRCMTYLNMRGLARIWISEYIDSIILFLTLKGYINHGVAPIPKYIDFLEPMRLEQKHSVIIVGAGLAGLSAARQLINMGIKVLVLEAGAQIGGRTVEEEYKQFGTSSQMIYGCHNNPMVVLCKQGDIKMQEIGDHCSLLNDNGDIVDEKLDKRMDFHFDAILDINKHLRPEKDRNLQDRFKELHDQFKEESGIKFTKEEESLLQFQMSNLEYACGASLSNVSSLYWDQNEEFPQFHGPPAQIQNGVQKIVEKFAADIDIKTNSKVCAIDMTQEDVVCIETADRTQYQAAKVVVAVPLTVLKQDVIKFNPPLTQYKQVTLAAGHVEKVVVQFDTRFWESMTKTNRMFGHAASSPKVRGLFDVFYDISPENSSHYTLVSFISGDAVDYIRDKSDGDVIKLCLDVLQKMFPKQEISNPVQQYVSRWYDKEHINMSFCYIPVNAGQDAFDDMAKDIKEKVYFAGEATHGQFPQTLTGAYMSGLREAEKIYNSFAGS